jgi:tetratricopeptide (TPR) repeat protein
MGMRAAGLIGFCLFLLGAFPASAQRVDLAALAPDSPVEGCLKAIAPLSSGLVAACNEALVSGGLEGTDRALAFFNRGRARQALGDKTGSTADLHEATARYTDLLEKRSPQPDTLLRRGMALHALGDTDKALADYNLSARLDPLNPLVFMNRGILLARRHESTYLAMVDFERVIALEPADYRLLRRAEQERAALINERALASVALKN